MAERIESEGFYEMLWDCAHCDTKGLLGKSQRHCANCGAPQDPDKRYFPKKDEAKPVDGHRFEGSDRHCPACNTPMGSTAHNCTSCGSPLDGSKEVRGVAAPVAAKPKKKIWPIVLAVIVALGVAIWFLFIRKTDATLTVTAHRWERSIAIEQYGEWQQEAWRDVNPAGATLTTCVRKERTTKQVEDGENCTTENVDKKDGTFEVVRKCTPKYRSEPVMDDWCTFTARNWKKVDDLRNAGVGMTPAWPNKAPAADTVAAMGATRSGARTETLYLDFGKAQSCKVDDAKWRKYKDGEKVKIEVRARSRAIVCSTLE